MKGDNAVRQAELKIIAARESGATELDLRAVYRENEQLKLTDLPESLAGLAQLKTLDLANNDLMGLPEWLAKLTQLESLDIANNRLTELPEWLNKLTHLHSLRISRNHLTLLPESLGRLTQLRRLDGSNNQLRALPESLGDLGQLTILELAANKLTALPESLDRLHSLTRLDLAGNQLKCLPNRFKALAQLKSLLIYGNLIDEVPPCIRTLHLLTELNVGTIDLPEWLVDLRSLKIIGIGDYRFSPRPIPQLPSVLRKLSRIKSLNAIGCKLGELPEWLGELTELEEIYLQRNELRDLPSSIANLKNLTSLKLDRNPLNPELAAADERGFAAVARYLRELGKGARKRYEAKLLILGDGNEGKTCVSRALRGLPFRTQSTTRGVDVEQWIFPHPDYNADRQKDITLNIWDFEGQEISHQTHQFFLTSQSLYVLVFKCRDQFLMDRAEYWLDTIRARAPRAKVAIVVTQCETRAPHVPLDRLQAQYGDILAKEWFFTVGCENGFNIGKLQAFLQRSAADLDFMGWRWPTSFDVAEAVIKTRAKRTAYISREKLHTIFTKADVTQDSYEDAATAMARLGVITQFADCPDLRDFLVLRPQWLTKAISMVMDDGKLSEDKGEITLRRMEEIWTKAHYRGMFAIFHNCMKEFELCYDLEDDARSCLLPLRFGYLRPTIPWSNIESVKERRVEYKLNIRPPMGIMSRFIVKTHHMMVKTPAHPNGTYWHNGVFLRMGNGPLCSEALCEFAAEDRTLRIEVRAAFPQNLCEQIHAYVKAVFSFFIGLEPERSYGCIKVDPQTQVEQRCAGLHTEKRIYSAISKQRVLDCEFEDHDVDPQQLIWGFSSFNDFVIAKVVSLGQLRQELDKHPAWATPFLRGIDALVDWANGNGGKLDQLLQAQSTLGAEFRQEAELKLHEYLAYMSEMLDDRDHTSAPGLISITTKDRSRWNPVGYFKSTYVLSAYCECEGNIHVCEDCQGTRTITRLGDTNCYEVNR